MIRGLYTAVSGMITEEAKQNVITNNLANVTTPGFKSDNLSVKQFDEVLLYNYDKKRGNKNVRQDLGGLSMGSKIDEVNTYFQQGMIEKTERNTDFAIQGRGFFVIERQGQGGNERLYTRNGHFYVNNRGFLVNDSGDNVIGRNNATGAIEPIRLNTENFTLTKEGNILVNGNTAYTVQVADFQNYGDLRKVGQDAYTGNNPIDSTDYIVKQGNLEKSNVNTVREMIEMMTVMRTFETSQKVIQSIDETLGKAVNELGSVR
ncbi:flagellar basal-body rod protein FlgG [Clostridium cochlearium]|jgi:flagellar basal-body rod protein FlgG|uniref:Flagellar basal-body rod protein FlgG n=1 Tax=Clostridium cochlearium TaxID=1494 RepID=A0A240ACH2_CLOCO|nr:flagellar basal-body rod protein FlgG [Clostridium cochlearium]MBV1819637.1 flagellar basal body rod protein FlgG [Bacteroidales bacterium MSK.15.36]NSJ91621.1 flagellar basal body rod protein FlgG [Coprococcus sp. MSK.21.13]MBE6065287.1 flagellar basal body rod protein FlgG [Clostridium cochlearium]MBU5269050.1 flagellar basal body rod protein FlgG [Clostridium cochlearium]MCG4570664.1 flagellar basal body rod protein FlgG [Clostridium cochlearium]